MFSQFLEVDVDEVLGLVLQVPFPLLLLVVAHDGLQFLVRLLENFVGLNWKENRVSHSTGKKQCLTHSS